jgi:hypothetical protein
MRFRVEVEFVIDLPDEFEDDVDWWLSDTTERLSNLDDLRLLRWQRE